MEAATEIVTMLLCWVGAFGMGFCFGEQATERRFIRNLQRTLPIYLDNPIAGKPDLKIVK